MKRLIIFLVRMRLGLKTYEMFQFSNQKTNDIYYFTETALAKKQLKYVNSNRIVVTLLSGVSLNWLLNKDCKIRKVGDRYEWYDND